MSSNTPFSRWQDDMRADQILQIQTEVGADLGRISAVQGYLARINKAFTGLLAQSGSAEDAETDPMGPSAGELREAERDRQAMFRQLAKLWQMQEYERTGQFGNFTTFWNGLTPEQQAAPDSWLDGWNTTVWQNGRMMRLAGLAERSAEYIKFRSALGEDTTEARQLLMSSGTYYRYSQGEIVSVPAASSAFMNSETYKLQVATVPLALLAAIENTVHVDAGDGKNDDADIASLALYWCLFAAELGAAISMAAASSAPAEGDGAVEQGISEAGWASIASNLALAGVYIAAIIGRALDETEKTEFEKQIDNIKYASNALNLTRPMIGIALAVDPALAGINLLTGAGTLFAGTAQALNEVASIMSLVDMYNDGADSRLIAAAAADIGYQTAMTVAMLAMASSGIGVLPAALLATANFSQFAVADMYFDMADAASARYDESGWSGDQALSAYYRQQGNRAVVNGMPVVNIFSSLVGLMGSSGSDLSHLQASILTEYIDKIENDPDYMYNDRYKYTTREEEVAAAARAFWDDGFDSWFSDEEREKYAKEVATLKAESGVDRVVVYVVRQMDMDAEMMGWEINGTIRNVMKSGRTYSFTQSADGADQGWDPFAEGVTEYDLSKGGDTVDVTQYVTFSTPFTGVEQEVREDVGSGKKSSSKPVLPKSLSFKDGDASTTFDARLLAPAVKKIVAIVELTGQDGRKIQAPITTDNVDNAVGEQGGIILSMGAGSDRVIAAARAMKVDGGSDDTAGTKSKKSLYKEQDVVDYSGYFEENGRISVSVNSKGGYDVLKKGTVDIVYRYVKEDSQGKNKPVKYTAVSELRTYKLDGNTDKLENIEAISGTSGNDRFELGIGGIFSGLDGDDVFDNVFNDTIVAGDGDDVVRAASKASFGKSAEVGNYIDGGYGDDRIILRAGDDSVIGGFGHDIIDAGAGNDLVIGDGVSKFHPAVADSRLRDFIDGGDGDDSLMGGYGPDTLLGGAGKDLLFGEAGDDSVDGQGGDDILAGDDGDDSLAGGNGSDSCWGGDGNDTIAGGAGKDYLYGESGNDSLYGGGDDDLLAGGWGRDRLEGGGGDDVLLGEGENDVIYGGKGNDTIIGGAGNDSLYGEDGDDCIFDDDGIAIISAGAGEDIIVVGSTALAKSDDIKNARLDGGEDLDIVSARLVDNAGSDGLRLGVVASLQAGMDAFGNSFTGPSIRLQSDQAAAKGIRVKGIQLIGIENLEGSAGDDALTGDGGSNVLFGREGSDSIAGLGGDDILYGGRGMDVVLGGDGHDIIFGDAGDDVLIGGAGGDTFVFAGAFDNDNLDIGPGSKRWEQNGDILLFMDVDYRDLLLRPMTGNALEIKRVMTLSDGAYGQEFFTGTRDDSVLVSSFGNDVDGYADISLVARAGDGWAVLTGAALQALIGEMNVFLGAEGNLALDWNNTIDPAWRQKVLPTQEALWSVQSAA